MTRELLQQAIAALNLTKPVHDSGTRSAVEGTIAALTAALAQPEQEPVAYAVLTPAGAARIWFGNRDSAERWHFSFGSGETLTPLFAAPPAPDADQLRRDLADMTAQRDLLRKVASDAQAEAEAFAQSFDRMHGTISTLQADRLDSQQLRKDLADMTAQRDQWNALMDIAREAYDTTTAEALADMNAADIDADRLDAQRWRKFLDIFDAICAEVGREQLTTAIDAAMGDTK